MESNWSGNDEPMEMIEIEGKNTVEWTVWDSDGLNPQITVYRSHQCIYNIWRKEGFGFTCGVYEVARSSLFAAEISGNFQLIPMGKDDIALEFYAEYRKNWRESHEELVRSECQSEDEYVPEPIMQIICGLLMEEEVEILPYFMH